METPGLNIHNNDLSCCETCLETECNFLAGASFDQEGDLLVPTEDYQFWQNDSPPKWFKPAPCCWNIIISGISNYDFEDSWIQTCSTINGSYFGYTNYRVGVSSHLFNKHQSYGSYIIDWSDSLCAGDYSYSEIFSSDFLCEKTQPFSGIAARRIIIRIALGIDSSSVLTINNTSMPNGNGLYKEVDRSSDGRPQLNFIAIMTIIGSYNTYVFKKVIRPYDGDYIATYNTLTDTYYVTGPTSNMIAEYGSFDARNFPNFTISYGDLFYSSNCEVYSGLKDCNLSGLSVSVTAQDNNLKNCDNNEGALLQGATPVVYDLSTYYPNLAYEGSGILGYYYTYDNLLDGNMRDDLGLILPDDPMGLASCKHTVTITNMAAVDEDLPLPSSTPETCYDTDNINGTYNTIQALDPAYLSYYYMQHHYTKFDDICCMCSNSGCLNHMYTSIDQEGYENVLSCSLRGGTPSSNRIVFKNYMGNNGSPYPSPMDFDGNTYNLSLSNNYRDWIHDASSASVSVEIGTSTKIPCTNIPTECTSCHDRIGPKQIAVTLPNGWENFEEKELWTALVACVCEWGESVCTPLYYTLLCSEEYETCCGYITEYNCGPDYYGNSYTFTCEECNNCLPYYDPDDCSIQCSYRNQSLELIYITQEESVDGYTYCSSYLPYGEFILDKIPGQCKWIYYNTDTIRNGCSLYSIEIYFVGDGFESMVGLESLLDANKIYVLLIVDMYGAGGDNGTNVMFAADVTDSLVQETWNDIITTKTIDCRFDELELVHIWNGCKVPVAEDYRQLHSTYVDWDGQSVIISEV